MLEGRNGLQAEYRSNFLKWGKVQLKRESTLQHLARAKSMKVESTFIVNFALTA
jgi:hypothetical protein